jgi:hypothetical protein
VIFICEMTNPTGTGYPPKTQWVRIWVRISTRSLFTDGQIITLPDPLPSLTVLQSSTKKPKSSALSSRPKSSALSSSSGPEIKHVGQNHQRQSSTQKRIGFGPGNENSNRDRALETLCAQLRNQDRWPPSPGEIDRHSNQDNENRLAPGRNQRRKQEIGPGDGWKSQRPKFNRTSDLTQERKAHHKI